MVSRNDITELLQRANDGDAAAHQEFWRIAYDELRELAHQQLARERAGHTLLTTDLVQEAYLKLATGGSFENRRHFFRAAARAMRQILVDHARGRRDKKELEDLVIELEDDSVDIEEFDRALTELAATKKGARHAQVVELRCFVGSSVEEAADVLGVSAATIKRDWDFACAWLRRRMRASGPP